MKKISIKNTYLLLIILMGLIFLGVSSTFAMFTASAEINNPITINSNLEYEEELFDIIDVTIEANKMKKITINVDNNSSKTMYYALWYINNNNKDIDIEITDYEDNHTSIGSMASGASTRTYSILIVNNDNSTSSVTLGILTGDNEVFNLGTGMELIPGEELVGGVNKIYNIYTPNSDVTEGNNVIDSVDKVNQIIEDPNGNIHYYGENPNNYIKFNCSAYPSTNCEIWRIIGVVDGKVKLIRNESIGNFSWDSSSSTINSGYGINEWSQADIKTELNTLYYTSSNGSCYTGASNATTTCNFSSTGIKNNNTNIIADATYYLGGYNNSSIYPNQILTYERGSQTITNPTDGVTRTLSWTGKIALPYPSDYAYATDLSQCNKTLDSYNSSDNSYACRGNNWMWYTLTGATSRTTPTSNVPIFITPYISTQYYAYGLNPDGHIDTLGTYIARTMLPTLYLNENIDIDTSHAGTSSDPYTLKVYDYAYTGTEQTFTVPESGTYQLEVWGASGGYSLKNGVLGVQGGFGGYASGKIELERNNILYVNVGGKGTNATYQSNAAGGYNGGGLGTWDNNDDEASGGGGGATHIATRTGLLSSLESYRSNILIVAGGGGGASWTYTSGSGGGFKGVTTSTTNTNEVSQSTGYAFGRGQDASGTGDSDGVAGGGAGYYGGYMNNVAAKSAGSGGSGYIGNSLLTNKVMYCYNCETSNGENTKTITTTNYSSSPISNYPKEGNGFVRIIFTK